MIRTHGAFALLALPLFAACNDDDGAVASGGNPAAAGPADSLETIDLTGAQLGIVDLPAGVDPRIAAVFARYTAATTRSGARVHLLAASGIPDELLFRTRAILAQHLGDVDDPTSTVDKGAVEDAMTARDATLAVVADAGAWDTSDPDVAAAVDLFADSLEVVRADRMVLEASAGYVLPSPDIDGTHGDTAAFVLRQGVAAAEPGFATELDAATSDAVVDGRFVPPAGLDADRVDDAYLALALDVYYGVWGHDPRGDGMAGDAEVGEYAFHTRAGMVAGDPQLVAALERFFPGRNTFPAFLSDDFAQTFEMEFSAVLPYTHRSQYLERVGVRENGQVARVNGNALDNVFVGNAGANVFEGRGGNDVAEMGGGDDAVFFEGPRADYTITEIGPNTWRVEDNALNRDGIDDVRGAARLEFADGTVFL
ncbi:MAG: hypothetical protein AAFP86_10065 [Planctomycetota bacterium]